MAQFPGSPCLFPQIIGIILPLLAYEITLPIETYHPVFQDSLTFCLRNMYFCFHFTVVLQLSLLLSFPQEAKDIHLAARPRNSPETWDMITF